MGFWSKLTGGRTDKTVDTVEKASLEDWFKEFGGLMTSSGATINQTTAMQVTAVMACVRIRSQDIAKLPTTIYRRNPDGSKTEARDHDLFKIFRRPNDFQTWFEFIEGQQTALLLRGNAYAAVLRNPRGKPLAMIPINPDWVSIYESVTGDIFYQVARNTPHLTAMLSSFPLRIPADDIFHLRGPSLNSLVGISPIGLAAEAIGLARSQERLAANLMGNGARPSGILSTDGKLTPDVIKRLKDQWDSLHSGADRSGKTAILEQGLKWTALTLNSVDLEFIASRKLQVEEICRAFGVSPIKIGVMDSGVGRAFEQIQLAHYADVVHPDIRRWELKLEQYFNLEPELEVTFDETELLRTDLTSRANAARVLQVSGIATPNESRASFGWNPYKSRPADSTPDGDSLLVPANVVPIEKVGEAAGPGPGSDQTGAPAHGGDGDPIAIDSAG